MNWQLLLTGGIGLCLLAIGFTGQAILASSGMELWYLHHSYLSSDAELEKTKKLMDQAAAAGYTGAVLWDSSFSFLGNPDLDSQREGRLRQALQYAQAKHLKTIVETAPFGWSNDVLHYHPDLAESQQVVGARFQVAENGRSLRLVSSLKPLVNGDFASAETGWFEMHDPGIRVDPTAHTGQPAVVISNPAGNARLRQQVAVEPWHQYHISLSYRLTGTQFGAPMVAVYDAADLNKIRLLHDLRAKDQWTDLHFVFNSRDSHQIVILTGIWGGASATLQLASIKLEETAFAWISHRDGAPFKLYDPANPEKVYTPGVDYADVYDPKMRAGQAYDDSYHTPDTVTLPDGTQLKPGQTVAADYFAVNPMANNRQVAMCLTDHGVFAWLAKNAQYVKRVSPSPDGGVLLAYDELLQANSCGSCRAKNLTAGELLAWNFAETFGIYRQAVPEGPIWVWNDMFDPYHNARDNFYLVEGTLAGSWKGLPAEVSILNWNLDKLRDSLTWFSGKNPDQPIPHTQIIAGFYDRSPAAAEARREINEAIGVPGVRGIMYTTWSDDYSQMKAFADAAKAAWPDYVRSVPAAQQ